MVSMTPKKFLQWVEFNKRVLHKTLFAKGFVHDHILYQSFFLKTTVTENIFDY